MSPVVRVLRCIATLLLTRALSDGLTSDREEERQPSDRKKRVSACKEAAQAIAPLDGQRRLDALAALRKEGARLGNGSEEERRFVDEVLPGLADQEIFAADVDNDGGEELLVTTREGSGGYLVLWVFVADGQGWRLAPDPTGAEQAFAGAHEYHNPLTADARQLIGRNELLVRHCGRVYLNFAGWLNRHWFRDTYLWQGGKMRRLCDPAWLVQQRALFQALFDRGQFAEAHAQLEGVQDSCRAEIEDPTWLWMQSDLALAAQRWHAPDLCLQHVGAATRAPEFAHASRQVRHALETNRALCTADRAKTRETARGYDASWILSLADKSTNALVWDARFAGFVAALVPDAALPGTEPTVRFRDEFEMDVSGPPEDVRVRDGRYATLAGCRAHDCGGNTAFAWVDVTGKRSIFGLQSGVLASRNVAAAEVPAEFWRDADEWLPPQGQELTFIEPDGAARKLPRP